jgi:hypothetical protein
MAEETDVETEDEAAAEVTEQAEPQPVGHRVVQDNVSEPGVQHTHQVDEDGEIVETSSHGGPEDEDPPAPDGEIVSDEALVGSAGAAAADDGSGDDGGDDDEE